MERCGLPQQGHIVKGWRVWPVQLLSKEERLEGCKGLVLLLREVSYFCIRVK